MNKALLISLCCFQSCGSTGMGLVSILKEIPNSQKEIEAKDTRVKQCLSSNPPTCISTWDQSRGAWVIKHKEASPNPAESLTVTK